MSPASVATFDPLICSCAIAEDTGTGAVGRLGLDTVLETCHVRLTGAAPLAGMVIDEGIDLTEVTSA